MFLDDTKKLFIVSLIIFSNNLARGETNQNYIKKNSQITGYQTINQIKEVNKSKNIDPIELTAKRIIFKSFIKSVWKMAETHHKAKNYEAIKYKLGEVASSLMIDEALPSKDQNKIQKISEKLLPIVISECILFQYKKNYKKNADQTEKPTNVFLNIVKKLTEKTIKSYLFLDKKNKYYNLSKYTTISCGVFLNTKNLSWDKKWLSLESLNLKVGIKNIINEIVKTSITSKQVNLGKALNKKHRKKAIAKAINIILQPFIDELFE